MTEAVQLYLSRRNLMTLLSKLDRQKDGDATACTIIKSQFPVPLEPFAQSVPLVVVTAVEDDVYYASQDRVASPVHPADEL